MTALRSLVERHLRAFNTRDFDAYGETLHPEVEITVDARAIRGIAAAREYSAWAHEALPGVRAELERVIAEHDDTIVVEYRLVNPADGEGGWQLAGKVCEVIDVRDGRIAALHSYYAPAEDDRTDAAPLPSHAEAARIAEEQAALRRVATLVARGVPEREVFAAVNEEIAKLVGADPTSLMRFGPDDTITLVAAWSASGAAFPIGATRAVEAGLRELRDHGTPIRFGPAELPPSGPFVAEAREMGLRAAVGVPIEVDGQVWGVSFAASSTDEPFPDDAEERIAGFAELVATAIANAQARSDLRALVREQQALRRVATLVARGASQTEVFDAVAREAAEVLGEGSILLMRYQPDGGATVVAVAGGPVTVGVRVPPGGRTIVERVRQTGLPARIDDYADVAGGHVARRFGVTAAVGAPIFVEGQIWGLMMLAVTEAGPLPAGTEHRLAQFGEVLATAIANADSRAELTASRARVAATADETRRRIQRDVHDGVQQRLIHTVVALELYKQTLGDGPDIQLVDDALQHAERGIAELRELVSGIMPAALSRGGLRAALEALVEGMDLPVRLEVTPDRLPAATEITAYFVVAEALTNTVKHADAAGAVVRATAAQRTLWLEIRDDGAGGADPAGGSGLVGLGDRVAAGGGRLTITSPPGEGTTISVVLPFAAEPRDDAAHGDRSPSPSFKG